MSLDVYLKLSDAKITRRGSGIFIRDNGQNREISREEWDERFPDREPVTYQRDDETDMVFESNITHNLNAMAKVAGIYEALWRPDEIGISKASQLSEPLQAGLIKLISSPEEFRKHNPSNGWGSYEGLVKFVTDYLIACNTYPDADVSVWG